MVDDLAVSSSGSAPSKSVEGCSWFDRAAIWIAAGALAMGALRALQVVAILPENGVDGVLSWVGLLARAAYELVAHGMAGLALAVLVRALGVGLRGFSERARWEIPRRDFPPEPEPRSEPASVEPAESVSKTPDEDLAEVRRLIELGDWDAADERVGDLRAERPDDPRVERIADELQRAKRTIGERWTEQLRAAREVNDPNRVLELYAQTPPVQDEEGRRALDQDLAGWFLSLVHRRLRGGGIQLEIVTLAERVSDSFAHTVEGASLRAALPTLRRSVGLCPRCGRPYAGTADACPICLAGKTTDAATTDPESEQATVPGLEPEDVDEPTAESRDSEWFVERSDDEEDSSA